MSSAGGRPARARNSATCGISSARMAAASAAPSSRRATGSVPVSRPLANVLEFAMPLAVAEVDHQADRKPAGEPQPVGPAQAINHRAAHQDPEDGHELNRGHGEAALDVGPL